MCNVAFETAYDLGLAHSLSGTVAHVLLGPAIMTESDQGRGRHPDEPFQLGPQFADLLAEPDVATGEGPEGVLGRCRKILDGSRTQAFPPRSEGSGGAAIEGFPNSGWGQSQATSSSGWWPGCEP